LNDAATVYVPAAQVAPGLTVDLAQVNKTKQTLNGPQAKEDGAEYFMWQKTDAAGGPEGKYLVNDRGQAVWLVDPGINGAHDTRPDGSKVRKFDAPKATLVSYIIKGILDQKLPWALVLLSASTPIFVGGVIRWLVDRRLRQTPACRDLTADEFTAESDKSPGVMLSSGYIAGGAIAGIIIAVLAGVPGINALDGILQEWSSAHNPFYAGPQADLLSLIPFAALSVFLYLVAREKILRSKSP
jgi:hypothetical protein